MGTHYGPENTGPVRRFGEGGGDTTGLLSLPDAQLSNVLWVDVGANPAASADGSCQLPYHSIDVAVNAAAALTPTASNPVAIIVMPGEYRETVTLDTDYVYLFGWNRETTIIKQRTAGGNALDVTSELTAVRGLTLEAEDATVRPVHVATGSATPVLFEECTVLVPASAAAVLVDTTSGVRWKDCDFIADALTTRVYHQNSAGVTRSRLDDCRVLGYLDFDQGSWNITGCEIDGYIDCAANGDARLLDTRVTTTSGAAVRGLPTGAEVRDCVLTSQGGNYDIDNTGVIGGLMVIEHVIMNTLGMSVNINKQGRRYIGSAGDADFFNTFVEAMSSMSNVPVTIELLKDVTVAAPGIVLNFTGPLTIVGNGHSMSRANGATVVYGSGWMRFVNVNIVGEVYVAAASVTIELLEGTRIDGRIDAYYGDSLILLDGAEIFGDAYTGHCIRMRDPYDTLDVHVFRSRLKGATGSPAIYYDAGQSHNTLKVKHSTIWHGSGGANLPFARDAAQNVQYWSHHSRYNADPQGGGWATNQIAAAMRFDAYDVQTDY